jgi:hypothetical protein
MKIKPGRRVRLSLKPSVGDPDLFVFGRRARSVRTTRPLRSSIRRGEATERVTVRNRRRGTRTIHVAVGFEKAKKLRIFNASYVLRAR